MLKGRFRQKTDSSAAWRENNPILLKGESGYESDTNLSKIGDGVHSWNELQYVNSGAAVSASTATLALDALALGGTSAQDWNKKFDSYVLNSSIEASMSTASATNMIPTSQAVVEWVLSQNFAGTGDVTVWEDF